MELGKLIRERRKDLGYTQRELSHITGISHTYISDLENGKSKGAIKTIKILCEALLIEELDILKED